MRAGGQEGGPVHLHARTAHVVHSTHARLAHPSLLHALRRHTLSAPLTFSRGQPGRGGRDHLPPETLLRHASGICAHESHSLLSDDAGVEGLLHRSHGQPRGRQLHKGGKRGLRSTIAGRGGGYLHEPGLVARPAQRHLFL